MQLVYAFAVSKKHYKEIDSVSDPSSKLDATMQNAIFDVTIPQCTHSAYTCEMMYQKMEK